MDQKPDGFVDLYGTAERLGVDDDYLGPAWKVCPQGKEELWKVFWGYGVFGSGVVLALALGILFFAPIIGLMFATEDAQQAAPSIWFGIGAALTLGVPYTLWLWISLWRCAPNCQAKVWGHVVRAGILLQAGGVIWAVVYFSSL